VNECVFCKIINKEKSADIVYEAENLIVFKDMNPKAPVHLLIIPKKHVKSIISLTKEDYSLISDIVFTAKNMAVKQGLIGYRLSFNVGREGGQVVDHLHMHLLGGWKESTASAV
jgi:histidine triad (HIT) family protein